MIISKETIAIMQDIKVWTHGNMISILAKYISKGASWCCDRWDS